MGWLKFRMKDFFKKDKVLNLVFVFIFIILGFGHKISRADSYKFKVESVVSDVYLSVWHCTKNQPKGYLLFARNVDTSKIKRSASYVFKINGFEVSRKEGDVFFKIEKMLTKVLRASRMQSNLSDVSEQIKWLHKEDFEMRNLLDICVNCSR